MTETDKAPNADPNPTSPRDADPSPPTRHNPFGDHPEGIGPTLGEDLDEDETPTKPTGRN